MNSGEIKFPVTTITAANFLVFLREKGYSKFTIKLGLVSLKWVNSFFPSGPNEPLKDKFLDRIVESAKRNLISKKNQKLPFSKEMIIGMMQLGDNPSLIQLRNALIPALSFSLLLRNDELRHLSCKHIIENDKGLIFMIVSSKTDVYRDGKKLFLANPNGNSAVVNLLYRYMRAGGLKMGTNSFLFGEVKNEKGIAFINGSIPLSHAKCLEIVKSKTRDLGFNANEFGTHSARSGGATTLAPRVSPFELMLSGRWADARSLRNYVQVEEDRRFQISEHLCL